MALEQIKILIVDDEVNSTKILSKILVKKGYNVIEINDSEKALEAIKNDDFHIIISDLQMPGISGLDLLKAKPQDSIFIMITGYGSVDTAVESMKLGAYDYINKPFNIEEFTLKVDKAVERIMLTKKIKDLEQQVEETYSFSSIVGKSKKMNNVFNFIRNVAKTDVNILIEGPSGSGKELVSRAIHHNSPRAKGPFIAINCSAIPDNLLESEMFGHVKGAFTGASDNYRGVFEQANGGTLLLDEIAEMPLNLQAKLLRVIEDWEIKPLGSDKYKKVDIRLISATNQNLKEFIKLKKFREDLYYRIATVTVTMPSLAERREDIPVLVDYFIKKFTGKFNRNISITADALNLLVNSEWKGNVRELENAIERAIVTSTENNLGINEFRFISSEYIPEQDLGNVDNLDLKEVEKLYIKKVLDENEWNKLKASQILGIDRKTLYKKIREYNLE